MAGAKKLKEVRRVHSKVRKDVFVVLALAFVVMLMSSVPAQALPMFARRSDGANCTKCHWQQNALNATGRAYLKHGIRDVGETVDLREAELRLSQYMSLVVAPSLSAVKNDTTAFSGGEVALWTGGPVDSNFSLVSEIAFLVDEDAVEAEEVYAHFVTNAGTGQNGKAATVGGAVADGEEEDEPEAELLSAKYLSARVGQFQPFLLLGQVSGPPRISLSRPVAMSGKATNGNSFRPRSRLRGLEVGAVNGPLSAYLGIGNGPQQNAADNAMDMYATVERDLGTSGSSVGAYAYWGKAVLSGGSRDSFRRYGVIGNCTLENTRLVGGFLLGSNDNPGGASLDNDGWFLEWAQHVGNKGTVAYARWDKFNADLAAGGQVKTDGMTLGISWTPNPDAATMRLAIEGQWLDEDSTDQDGITTELQLTF
ncbi:MAG: hypothetical protein A2147_00980 [Chloroflexi bacterium RBG_16_57_8]|nr:MAG: hypothetical protein A2147_00980 [Chloroflexi bacterium RBG_16_57_8]